MFEQINLKRGAKTRNSALRDSSLRETARDKFIEDLGAIKPKEGIDTGDQSSQNIFITDQKEKETFKSPYDNQNEKQNTLTQTPEVIKEEPRLSHLIEQS